MNKGNLAEMEKTANTWCVGFERQVEELDGQDGGAIELRWSFHQQKQQDQMVLTRGKEKM